MTYVVGLVPFSLSRLDPFQQLDCPSLLSGTIKAYSIGTHCLLTRVTVLEFDMSIEKTLR